MNRPVGCLRESDRVLVVFEGMCVSVLRSLRGHKMSSVAGVNVSRGHCWEPEEPQRGSAGARALPFSIPQPNNFPRTGNSLLDGL
ncbi:hypothetical protein MHYP_G00152960 [Metynnis hypsauchen]